MPAHKDQIRWLFAGQLGPLFDDGGRILIIEARSVFGRRPMHRAKAHLILSGLRHRAAELGQIEVIDPTSYSARRSVRKRDFHILPSRGFVSS